MGWLIARTGGFCLPLRPSELQDSLETPAVKLTGDGWQLMLTNKMGTSYK
jgi:hypothetical protein